ncbi:hypothetical protein HBI47_076740 [Parastagonospora nodorum]|nr:hypothetical protein HBI47_076740 [Parastagonospora nodorum]
MDDNLQPVPVGVQGEIVIGGAGVGGGYLKNPALSSQGFIPKIRDPQSHRTRGWNMMHRTGDVGRWRKDGNLLVQGRKSGDTQIKLRGLRIDLAEVENSMLKESQAMLEQVVVSVRYPTQPRAQSGRGFLVAHVKFRPNVLASRGEQQTFLNKALARLSLPRYMRPATAFPVEHFPMLVSGKLDRKAVAKLPLEQERLSSVGNTQTVSDTCTSREISKQYTIDSDTDFFHVCGNSTLLLKLQYDIQMEFGVSLSALEMFENTTLGAMARRIDPSDTNHSGSGINIDWSAETDVPNAIQKSLLSAKAVDFMTTRTIILTGATGFLGQAYLKALLSDSKVTAVHCVAVRLGRAGTKRLLSVPDSLIHHSKVEIHAGDLAEPRLGLGEETITRIFVIADCIIHNGADTSHVKSYTSIRKTNYESTQELIKICLGKNFQRMVPFHFVSSGSIWSSSGLSIASETSAAAYPPDQKLSTGYSLSKWASEIFLEKVFEQSKSLWPIYIHRPASIQPDHVENSETAGDTEAPPHLDLTETLLHYCRLTNSVPASSHLQGYLNQVSISIVVEDMMKALQSCRMGHGKIRYINEIGNVDIPLSQLNTVVSNAVEVEPEEWARRAAAAGLNPILHELFQSVVGKRKLVFPQLTKGC